MEPVAVTPFRAFAWLTGAGLVLLMVAVGVVAIGLGTGLILLPLEMHRLNQRLPVLFQTHMVASAMALLLLPPVVMLRRRPSVHKMLGRILGGFVMVGGLTALPVALLSTSSPAARAGFFVQGLVWLSLFTLGFLAIRRRERAKHARLMLAMAAVTTGAVWFRLFTGAAIALQLPFEPCYAASAWAGWMMPLIAVLLWPAIVPRMPFDMPRRDGG
jgi:Predicted membrane protein (DUF2306)